MNAIITMSSFLVFYDRFCFSLLLPFVHFLMFGQLENDNQSLTSVSTQHFVHQALSGLKSTSSLYPSLARLAIPKRSIFPMGSRETKYRFSYVAMWCSGVGSTSVAVGWSSTFSHTRLSFSRAGTWCLAPKLSPNTPYSLPSVLPTSTLASHLNAFKSHKLQIRYLTSLSILNSHHISDCC